jgi:hypothetical protein
VLLWWFIMLMISAAGPRPEVLNDTLTRVADVTPLKHVILTLQDPWLGFGSKPSRAAGGRRHPGSVGAARAAPVPLAMTWPGGPDRAGSAVP